MSVRTLFEQYGISIEGREQAKNAAMFASRHIPNSPSSGDLRAAANGSNEDLLLGIALILRQATVKFDV